MIDIHNSEVRSLNSKMGTKTALITGASSDIGQVVTTSLGANGFNIAAYY
jgi:short-subunit dehydrogenase